METPEDRQAAWYRAVRDGRPRGKHYGAPLADDPEPVEEAALEPEPPPVDWDAEPES